MMSLYKSHYAQFASMGIGIVIGITLPMIYHHFQEYFYKKHQISSSTENSKQRDKKSSTHAVRAFESCIHLRQNSLEKFVAKIIEKAGTSSSNATLVASVLLYADARGIPSHGVNRVDTYVNEICAGLVDGNATPVIEKKSGCCAVIDGKNGLGAVTASLAMDTAIQLAKEYGAGLVVCRHSNHFGAAGFWANMALENGLLGMSFTNTSPYAVPTGGNTRAVGTNPFCFFAPANGDNFQLDMATTVVPIGKIEVMDRLGKIVPEGWGVDRNGDSCTDGEEICRYGGLYPLGGAEETAGYKGYGLGMFVEIMCGILSDSAFGPEVQPWLCTRKDPIDYGHCFFAIDPNHFATGFEERLEKYLQSMRALPGNVKVAGDPEKEYEKQSMENGIMLHRPVAATLKKLAERFEVEVPLELEGLDSSSSKESLFAK